VKLSFSCLSLALLASTASAFTISGDVAPKTSMTQLNAENTRRSFFQQVAGSTAAAIAASTIALPAEPALAFGGKLQKINARLASYGLPQMGDIASGFTPLLEVYGKGKNRTPLLVNFVYPVDWVVTLPSQDINGEDGTIQAGEYARGDTATLYVADDLGKVDNINEQPKSFFEKVLIKSISQKGDNLYQNFKVTKIVPRTTEYKGQQYMTCDFKYQLLTGAGFEIDRTGVAAVTSAGDSVQVLWSASTAIRYKKTEAQLRSIVDSFRCYGDGLDLSLEKVVEIADEY